MIVIFSQRKLGPKFLAGFPKSAIVLNEHTGIRYFLMDGACSAEHLNRLADIAVAANTTVYVATDWNVPVETDLLNALSEVNQAHVRPARKEQIQVVEYAEVTCCLPDLDDFVKLGNGLRAQTKGAVDAQLLPGNMVRYSCPGHWTTEWLLSTFATPLRVLVSAFDGTKCKASLVRELPMGDRIVDFVVTDGVD